MTDVKNETEAPLTKDETEFILTSPQALTEDKELLIVLMSALAIAQDADFDGQDEIAESIRSAVRGVLDRSGVLERFGL